MDKVQNPVATIEMADGGVITVELAVETAPNTVKNFVALVKDGFYDGLIFHRVIPGFMLQGGCPQGSGMSGPGYTIKGEFDKNGFANPLRHKRGVISMARTAAPNSAGSQFFIMVADSPHLDGQYAAFGEVSAGMDVVDRIVAVKRDHADKPLEDQQIKKITVETFGVDYGQAEKLAKS
ncbi:MAG: peptidylprolyl isomerase [Dethiobacter sp.]|jgi:peptidyl-prolyl cis-trans isomerase B (cyclophilin B)|nr:peptidylprolyl isomerase [Dethiobacter sp.]MBS3899999.1 peptidylprolyl isomerase [Dethiobacter sp.]MBS3982896.1 peptidylprolyl isomerase [Dethiobacter sp.]MCL4463566.1 peptidylprolyl isomerase [Bacillota bacterium]